MAEAAAAIDMHPMWVNLEKAYQVLEGYPEAELDRKVFACIASYANSRGVCDPLQKTIAEKIGEIPMTVNRSVHRLVDKCLVKILRKEKKYQDIHPRNISQINKALLRTEPDTRSSHFDAEKWKPFAARLKKFVSDAVDGVKQVAVNVAKSMSASAKTGKPRKRSKKQWNNSYRNNSWQRNYAEPVLTPEEQERKHRIQQLIQQGENDLSKTGIRDGYYPALRYIADHVKKTPEKYDQIFHEAIDKYKDYVAPDPMEAYEQDANGHWWLKKDYKSHVPDVRMMSSEDEPLGFKGVLGAAFA